MWRIELGVGVGPFRLGASIAEVLHALKSRLPVRPFEISYDAVAPYKRDVVVDSAEDGFRVRKLLLSYRFIVVYTYLNYTLFCYRSITCTATL